MGVRKIKIDNSFFAASRIGPTLEQNPNVKNDGEKKGIAGGFEKIFDDMWNASAELSAESRAETTKLVTGELEDLPGMQIAGEKSSMMFELNLTVRSKVIDAYQEMLRTQV